MAEEWPEYELAKRQQGELSRLRKENEELKRRALELEKLVYVPGLWRCAKCEFHLVQANLNAADGTVTSRDNPGDECPNCHVPLWRVTERDAGNDMVKRCEEQMLRAIDAEKAIASAPALPDEKIEQCLREYNRVITKAVDDTKTVTHGDRLNAMRAAIAAIEGK